MEAQIHTQELTIIYNSDVKVIDFLSDLKDRGILAMLQGMIAKDNDKSICMVAKDKADDLIVVVMYHDPFGYNHDDNTLLLFAHPSLRTIISYFCRLKQQIPQDDEESILALKDILQILSYHNGRLEAKEVQTNHLG
jgi:hypothetical protein